MERDGSSVGWVLLPAGAVPPRWRSRAVPMFLVPLTPTEASSLLSNEAPCQSLDPEDLEVLQMLSRGEPMRKIASRTRTSLRTTERRIARLRERFGVSSTSDLIGECARRGF